MTVTMDYRGTPEEWTTYCRKLVSLYDWQYDLPGSEIKLRTIYLQRTEMEFEIKDEKITPLGELTAVSARAERAVAEVRRETLPGHQP
jgi:hypothetical protein